MTYLWQRNRSDLLIEIINKDISAILVKVAGAGLQPQKHLGKDLKTLLPTLIQLNQRFQLDLYGEGIYIIIILYNYI